MQFAGQPMMAGQQMPLFSGMMPHQMMMQGPQSQQQMNFGMPNGQMPYMPMMPVSAPMFQQVAPQPIASQTKPKTK